MISKGKSSPCDQRFKETTVGKIPIDWQLAKAEEYCFRVTDGTHSTPQKMNKGKHLVTSKHLTEGEIDFNEAYLISKEDFNEINRRSKVEQWDVIIGMIGEYLGGTYLEKNKDINYAIKNVGLFKCAGDINKGKWLYYYLSSKIAKEYVAMSRSGTSQPYITLNSLREFPVISPENPFEMQKIIFIIDSIQYEINLLSDMNRTLEAIGQAVFKHWFVDFEFPNEEGKPYKSSGGEMIYNSVLDKEIPAKWAPKEIGDIAKINERSINRSFEYSEIEYIDIDSVDQGIIRNRQILRLEDAPSRAKRIVKNQDIIISTVRPNLKHFAFIQNVAPNTIVSTGFAVITPMKGTSKFLYYHLTTDKFTNYLSAIADSHTSTYPSFNPDIIQKSVVAYPDSNEKQVTTNLPALFDLILEGLFCKVENNSKQISTLSQLRDMLLPKLMSGKIRVPIQKETMEIQ